MLGEKSYGGTPRHIPNLEVKPINAESTWLEATWEDMNLPSFFYFLGSLSSSVDEKKEIFRRRILEFWRQNFQDPLFTC